MSQQNLQRIIKSDYLKLVPIIGLAFFIAFIPHQNYLYPVHIDEWFHMALSNELIRKGGIVGLTDPFSGGAPLWNQIFELGFHLFVSVFRQISGITWLDIVRYFPSIIFIMTVLSVYVLAQRQGFGWEAAFFACLVPTTVGILGPAFFVPVALGLLFIPLAIFLAFNIRSVWSYVVLCIFNMFLVCMHAATVVSIAIILVPYILLNLKGNFKHGLGITLALALPFIVTLFIAMFHWVIETIQLYGGRLLVQQPHPLFIQLPQVTYTYGYLPILIGLFGIFLLAMRRDKEGFGLILGLLALLVMLVAFFTFGYGEIEMYTRGLIYMMLVMSIVAGAALKGIRSFILPVNFSAWLRAPLIIKNIGNILCLALISLTLVFSIPQRQSTRYYHMIDQEDYQAFIWIKDNLSNNYDKAILDPWKATAFTTITQKKSFTRIHMAPTAIDNEAYSFLMSGCDNTTFLRENGISIVYTTEGSSNPDLVEVRTNVFIVKEGE